MARCLLDEALPARRAGSPLRAPREEAKRILREHAPGVAAFEHGARWDNEVQGAVRRAIASLPGATPEYRARVAEDVAHAIAWGRDRGIWDHTPWVVPTRIAEMPGRLRAGDQPRIDRASAALTRLLDRLPDLMACTDPLVIQGAAVCSAALTGGLMRAEFLSQVLTRPVEHYDGLYWMDLELGKPTAPWPSPRRWFVDTVTLALLKRGGRGCTTPDVALAAFADWLLIKPYDTEALARDARAWWTVRLPPHFIEYAVRPDLAPSLPAWRFRRVLTDAPLPRAVEAQVKGRLRTQDDPLQEFGDDTGSILADVPPATRDRHRERESVRQLTAALRRREREPEPSFRVLEERLDAWRQEFVDVGGWPWLLHGWVTTTLVNSRGLKGRALRRPGLLRYMGGFARDFVHVLRDVPPELAADREEEVEERMEALALQIATLPSADVARRGLSQFLDYVHQVTGIRVDMGAWENVAPPSQSVANLVTPGEFDRLLDALHSILPADTLPGLRARVMAQLAFATGMRWEMLHTLRAQNVFMDDDETLGIVVLRRRNAYLRGKTTPHGGVALEQVMPPAWLATFRRYFTWVKQLAGRKLEYLFADPLTPHLPPGDDLTRTLIQSTLRQVTGDPGIRLHDLRHAAANAALVALYWPPHPVPTALKHLRPFSAQARGILPEGQSYLALVTKRSGDDRSALYAVADFLGHSTPATTMRSYLHAVDAIFAAHVGQHLVLPAHSEALLDGVGREAVRKRRYRKRTTRGKRHG